MHSIFLLLYYLKSLLTSWQTNILTKKEQTDTHTEYRHAIELAVHTYRRKYMLIYRHAIYLASHTYRRKYMLVYRHTDMLFILHHIHTDESICWYTNIQTCYLPCITYIQTKVYAGIQTYRHAIELAVNTYRQKYMLVYKHTDMLLTWHHIHTDESIW